MQPGQKPQNFMNHATIPRIFANRMLLCFGWVGYPLLLRGTVALFDYTQTERVRACSSPNASTSPLPHRGFSPKEDEQADRIVSYRDSRTEA